jgi:hypothetical protein
MDTSGLHRVHNMHGMPSRLRRFRRAAALSVMLLLLAAAGCSSGADPAASTAPPAAGESVRQSDPTVVKLDAAAAVETNIEGFDPMLENRALRLYMNRKTAEIAVLDRRSGQVWRSNPADASQDAIASPYLKGKLSSQISLVYLTESGQNKDYDSYNHSVQYGQFEIAETDADVTVKYTFGNPDKGIESTPMRVSKERFEERLLGSLSDPADQDQLKTRYKFIAEENVYERRDIPKAVVKRLLGLFEKMNYTEEDLAIDNGENGGEGEAASANPKFTLAIRYALDEEHLVASVDTSAITEDTPPYRIHSIGVLEYFGAAGTADEGYMFLPDGSGTLVSLNNGRTASQPILMPIYGEDGALYVREKFNTLQPNRLPVYGMKKNDAAFLAVMEEGDGIAWLAADVSGRLHQYNVVSPQFVVLPKDEVRLSNNEIMHKTPKNMYRGELQIRYAFLSGEQADYSGMAEAYRAYLERTYGMKRQSAEADMPFYLELTGAVPKQKNLLGIPYEGITALTDLSEAAEIVDRLGAAGIRNVRLNYKGWFNNGLNHDSPSSIDMDGVIGNKREWTALSEMLKKNGGGLYPDVAFLRVYRDSRGFDPKRDSAQYISRRYAKIFEFDRAAYYRSAMSHYLLSPRKLARTVDGFLDDYEKLNTGALSLRDLGSELHSDYRRNGEVTRESAKEMVVEQLRRIRESVPELMISGGNAYALPYASHVLDVPDSSNAYQLAGESIPFQQMVMHGYVDYAGTPYNLAADQDLRVNVLRSLETGSSVYFNWIYEEPSVLKDTRFNYLYSNHYEDWLAEAEEAYAEVNGILKQVRGLAITRHEKLADSVYRTQYENGLAVIVNYGSKPYADGGVVLPAQGYAVEGG